MRDNISDFDLGFEVGYREVLNEKRRNLVTKEEALAQARRDKNANSLKTLLQVYGIDTKSIKIKKKGNSLRVEIQDVSVDKEEVDRIASMVQRYDTDAKTGEILSGGNFYVFADYAPSVDDFIRGQLSDIASKLESTLDKNDKSQPAMTTKKGNRITFFPSESRLYFNGNSHALNVHSLIDGFVEIVKQHLTTIEDLKTASF